MSHKLVFIFFLIIHLENCTPTESGVRVRISRSALMFAANLGVDQLANEINSMSIPNPPGSSTFSVTNIRITRFSKPTPNIVPIAEYGLSVSLNNAAIGLNFNWRYKIGSGWLSISDSGSASASTKSISISTTIKIERDSNGKPTASIYVSSCSISGFNYNIKSGIISALYNFMTSFFEGKIKNMAQDIICNGIKKAVNSNGNNLLSTLNTEVIVDNTISMSYKLSENPIFTGDYLETFLDGEFYTKEIKYTQMGPPTNTIVNNGKMFSLVLTERLFNSAGYILQQLGRLRQTFSINDKEIFEKLSLGNDTQLEVKIEATAAPFVKIETSSFVINATANITFQTTTGLYIANMILSIQLDSSIYFEGGFIKGRVNSIKTDVSTIKGNFPGLTQEEHPANVLMTTAKSDEATTAANLAVTTQKDKNIESNENTDRPLVVNVGGNHPAQLTQENNLTQVLDGLFALLLPSLNVKAASGFPIPRLSGMNLVNPTFSLEKGFVKLESDFQVAS